MNLRLLTVAGGIVAVGGWLATGAGVWREASLPPLEQTLSDSAPAIASHAAGIAAGVERLQARPRLTPPLPPPARNPFRFSERQPAPEARPPGPVRPVLSTAPAEAAAATSIFRLVGIAEDPGPGGPVRTAVVSGSDELFFLKVGDQFAGHFRVLAVSADAVRVEDGTTGTAHTLKMR